MVGSPLPHTPGSWKKHVDPNIQWWEETFGDNLRMYREYRISNGRAPDPFMYKGGTEPVHISD